MIEEATFTQRQKKNEEIEGKRSLSDSERISEGSIKASRKSGIRCLKSEERQRQARKMIVELIDHSIESRKTSRNAVWQA